MKVKAIIERGNDGSYGIYLDDDNLNFGIIGEGKEFPDLEFIYQYDTASFLEYYSKIISLAGLERLTGVNQGQLSHYLTGKRKPSAKTTQKIQRHLHAFGKELQHLEFA